jgi:hypothetical protein
MAKSHGKTPTRQHHSFYLACVIHDTWFRDTCSYTPGIHQKAGVRLDQMEVVSSV